MAPTDSTPNVAAAAAAGFEQLYTLQAYGKIPVHEYRSTKTGLTVVVANVDGPIVNGYFCLITEAHDDDGLPHTLEHLIFLGSEQYPYKGVLDLLANRCLASGTNAWTDVDHTCYTMETAGSEGFLTLMPIYLDHILYPTLSDAGFITEVYHVTGDGDDQGIVYCEMKDSENSAERRMHLTMSRKIYPGHCGYSAETGGMLRNLRESCNNQKVRAYHKQFYRPENLKLIITGQIKPEAIFAALEPVEAKILAKGARGAFERPWQSPVPPFDHAEHIVMRYPNDEETNGMWGAAWRGPSAVHEQYALTGVSMLMKYLSALAISPLQKEFVEIPDPYASKVSYNMSENSVACVYFVLHNVPAGKLPLVKPKFDAVLKRIVDGEDIDMALMKNIIMRHIQEMLSGVENSPHHTVAFMLIGHMLYGNTKADLEQRVNPIADLEKILAEPKSYWVELLRKYFVDGCELSIEAHPSIEEQLLLAKDEKNRIDARIRQLGPDGLSVQAQVLQSAIEFNERPPAASVLTAVPIPGLASISFHSIERFTTESTDKRRVDLSKTPIYTYFDHVKTNFVYMYLMLDTAKLPDQLRSYLPIMLEAIFESSIKRGDVIVPREEVITQLNVDVVTSCGMLGLGGGRAASFKVGSYGTTAVLMLQVSAANYAKGVAWMRDLLYASLFEVDVLKIIANKMINQIAQSKRSGRSIVQYALKSLFYHKETNVHANGILHQHAFLTTLLEQLDGPDAKCVIDTFEKVRDLIAQPANMALYCAADLATLKDAGDALQDLLPKRLKESSQQVGMHITPDHSLMLANLEEAPASCIIGMGCMESEYLFQATPSIKDFDDPDLPALMLYLQYIIQAEGPMWKQVRGKGFSYGYTMSLKVNEGLIYLVFTKATNVFAAYKEAVDIITKQVQERQWDSTLFESARSSLVFEIIDEEKTIGSAISLSLSSYFQGVDYTYNRRFLAALDGVTFDDLNRVGEKYLKQLFEPSKVKTAIVCNPAKVTEMQENFAKIGHKLEVYTSLEESFLKTI